VLFGYGLNYLIDIKHAVIVDVEATPARTYDEVAATKTMIERTERRFDIKPKRLAADTAYGTSRFLGWLVVVWPIRGVPDYLASDVVPWPAADNKNRLRPLVFDLDFGARIGQIEVSRVESDPPEWPQIGHSVVGADDEAGVGLLDRPQAVIESGVTGLDNLLTSSAEFLQQRCSRPVEVRMHCFRMFDDPVRPPLVMP
jgi:hypothetical protein